MATTLFFPPPVLPALTPHHLPQDGEGVLHLTGPAVPLDVTIVDTPPSSPGQSEDDDDNSSQESPQEEAPPVGTGVDLGTLTGRRVTLKPRRTLSLSPTPGTLRRCRHSVRTFARAGDMMARNLKAARCLDFLDKDDDDGLYQPNSEEEEENANKKSCPLSEKSGIKCRPSRRGSVSPTPMCPPAAVGGVTLPRRSSGSVKRPLEPTLPCQEIKYLDITYQKVSVHAVQFSPIPRKKIAYHPVSYHAIHYCDVPYWSSERPNKRKPLTRAHSIAVADLRDKNEIDWLPKFR